MEAIRKNGLKISGIWGKYSFKHFAALETDFKKLLRKNPAFDLILVTVKSYDTREAARMIAKLIRSPHLFPPPAKRGEERRGQPLVLSLQNGLGNIEQLERFIPRKQILAGRVIFGAAIPEPGGRK